MVGDAVSIGISQPLFRANTQSWDREQQELRYTSAERRYLEAREDVALATTVAYFDLYSATVAVANAQTNVLTNDTLYTLNKGRFEVGKIGENDLLQSELALLRARSSLDDARLLHDRTLAQFRLVVGLPSNAPVTLAAVGGLPVVDADTAIAVAQAKRNSSTMSDAELAEVSANRAVSESRWNLGSGGTLNASFGYNAAGTSATDAYKDVLNAQALTLSVQIPVWQWGSHGAQMEASNAERPAARQHGAELARAGGAQCEVCGAAAYAGESCADHAAKADTVAAKRFEVAYNRYVISRINDRHPVHRAEREGPGAGLVRASAAGVLDGVLPAAEDDAVRLRDAGVVALRPMPKGEHALDRLIRYSTAGSASRVLTRSSSSARPSASEQHDSGRGRSRRPRPLQRRPRASTPHSNGGKFDGVHPDSRSGSQSPIVRGIDKRPLRLM